MLCRLTMSRIIRKKSTEEFSCVPYITALLNCLLYTWYGLPVVSCGWENFPVVTINGLGILLELSFILIYFWFASPTRKASLLCMDLFGQVFMGHKIYMMRTYNSLIADEADSNSDTCYHSVLHHREHLNPCIP